MHHEELKNLENTVLYVLVCVYGGSGIEKQIKSIKKVLILS